MNLDKDQLSELFSDLIDNGYAINLFQSVGIYNSESFHFGPCVMDRFGKIYLGSFDKIKNGSQIFHRCLISFVAENKTDSIYKYSEWRDSQLGLFHGMKYLSDEMDFYNVVYHSDTRGFNIYAYHNGFLISNVAKLRSTVILLWKIYFELSIDKKNSPPTIKDALSTSIFIDGGRIIISNPMSDQNYISNLKKNVYVPKDFVEDVMSFKDIKNVTIHDKYIEVETSFVWAAPIKNK